MPFMKSRRVIPVLIDRCSQYGPDFARRRRFACQSGVGYGSSPVLCFSEGGCSIEPGGSQTTRPVAPPETVVWRLRRVHLRLWAVPGVVGRHGPRALAS